MKQQRLTFAGPGHEVTVTVVSRPWAQINQSISVKEEPLRHSQQVGPTCAYYALATLTGMPPIKVLTTAQQVLKESRLRKMNGTHDLLVETYRRLGYRFPWRQISHQEPVRINKMREVDLSGSGIMRITPRATSRQGHLVAYKEGIVYDSAMPVPLDFEGYIKYLKGCKQYWVRVINEIHLERASDGPTEREERAQSFLMKRPRRPDILRRAWRRRRNAW